MEAFIELISNSKSTIEDTLFKLITISFPSNTHSPLILSKTKINDLGLFSLIDCIFNLYLPSSRLISNKNSLFYSFIYNHLIN